MMESGDTQFYSRILVANKGKRQRGYSEAWRRIAGEALKKNKKVPELQLRQFAGN
jgi:hypothetical protein